MTFRIRLYVAFAAGMLMPLALLVFGIRREMTRQIAGQYEQRVEALAGVVRADLSADAGRTGRTLAALGAELAASNRFRLAVIQHDETERGWLLDYAGDALRLSGLAMLQIADSSGRVLSSGHFRNEFDRVMPELPLLLASASTGPALVRARTPDGAVLVIARVDSFAVAGQRFTIVGGRGVDSTALTRFASDSDLVVALATPDAAPVVDAGRGGRVLGRIGIPYIDAAATPPAADSAYLLIAQRPGALDEVIRRVDRWFLAAFAVTTLLALLLAAWLARQIGRPLAELAEKTAALDLDRLDQDFASDRHDEIGALSRLLGALTGRLRAGAIRLREAERRATVGDVARQVNHDVKNGLAPIRHVVRHLGEVARDEPERLAEVFAERRGTLDSSVDYLETLARNYARLSPALDRGRCDVNAIVRETLRGIEPRAAEVRSELAAGLPPIRSDNIALRRILENLVGNAVGSLDGKQGEVTVTTASVRNESGTGVRIAVADTGPGMTREALDRAFDDFHTTKPGGTGLGLSVVRRLVADLGGTLRVQTQPGAGTCFTVELPVEGGDA